MSASTCGFCDSFFIFTTSYFHDALLELIVRIERDPRKSIFLYSVEFPKQVLLFYVPKLTKCIWIFSIFFMHYLQNLNVLEITLLYCELGKPGFPNISLLYHQRMMGKECIQTSVVCFMEKKFIRSWSGLERQIFNRIGRDSQGLETTNKRVVELTQSLP